MTIGAVQDLRLLGFDRAGRFGIGGDVTLYRMSPDLGILYRGSKSFHAFLRWRPGDTPSEHVH